MDNITLVFCVAIAVGFALYMQIQKLTKNIDANKANDSRVTAGGSDESQKYKVFCELIDEQIRSLKILADSAAIDGKKDEFLESLSQISKKLTFIQTMNNSSSAQKWESELFSLLLDIENAVNLYLNDAESINTQMKERLKIGFSKL